MEDTNLQNLGEIVIFNNEDGNVCVQIDVVNDTIWLNQKGMSELFGTTTQNITVHLKNIFSSGELDLDSVCKEFLQTATDGKNYRVKFYNLDAIIAVGYRVNSKRHHFINLCGWSFVLVITTVWDEKWEEELLERSI